MSAKPDVRARTTASRNVWVNPTGGAETLTLGDLRAFLDAAKDFHDNEALTALVVDSRGDRAAGTWYLTRLDVQAVHTLADDIVDVTTTPPDKDGKTK